MIDNWMPKVVYTANDGTFGFFNDDFRMTHREIWYNRTNVLLDSLPDFQECNADNSKSICPLHELNLRIVDYLNVAIFSNNSEKVEAICSKYKCKVHKENVVNIFTYVSEDSPESPLMVALKGFEISEDPNAYEKWEKMFQILFKHGANVNVSMHTDEVDPNPIEYEDRDEAEAVQNPVLGYLLCSCRTRDKEQRDRILDLFVSKGIEKNVTYNMESLSLVPEHDWMNGETRIYKEMVKLFLSREKQHLFLCIWKRCNFNSEAIFPKELVFKILIDREITPYLQNLVRAEKEIREWRVVNGYQIIDPYVPIREVANPFHNLWGDRSDSEDSSDSVDASNFSLGYFPDEDFSSYQDCHDEYEFQPNFGHNPYQKDHKPVKRRKIRQKLTRRQREKNELAMDIHLHLFNYVWSSNKRR